MIIIDKFLCNNMKICGSHDSSQSLLAMHVANGDGPKQFMGFDSSALGVVSLNDLIC